MKEPFIEVDAEAAAELIEQGAIVVDVRQEYEYEHDHIEGARLVPISGLYSFALDLAGQNIAKDAPVIFVCEMGQRSAAAGEVAAIAGYSKIYNLMGGMNQWRYSGQPVVKGKR